MLEIDSLTFGYAEGRPVLSEITFSVEQGVLCGLYGPNGSGKTTLFKCVMGFLHYRQGAISVNGDNARDRSIRELARLVSYVPQEHRLSFPFPALEVVLMGRTPHARSPFGPSRKERFKALEVMEMLEISDIAYEPYNELSGGQRQLVVIARALAQETRLMLLDEPTSALDFGNQVRIWRLLGEIAREGNSVIACTHDPNHVSWFCDSVAVLNEGRVIAFGSTPDAISEPVLKELYGDLCRIHDHGSVKFVCPGDQLPEIR